MSGGTPVLVPGDTPGAMSSSAENPFVGMFEVSKHAVWSVSTAKHGNGVQQLLDGSPETFWQSDGAQPHVIDIQFNRLMRISELALYLDYVLDESYTPRKFSVRCGTPLSDASCGFLAVPRLLTFFLGGGSQEPACKTSMRCTSWR
eukprot:RCo036913